MMTERKYYNTEEFKALQAEWRSKLAEDGFEDIERHDAPRKLWAAPGFPPLKRCAAETERKILSQPDREAYFQAAGQYLWKGFFKDRTERIIWEYHSQGYGSSLIARMMKKRRCGRWKKTDKGWSFSKPWSRDQIEWRLTSMKERLAAWVRTDDQEEE